MSARRLLSLVGLLLGLAAPAGAQSPAVVEYYHVDAIGSVRAVTNKHGAVTRRHDYFPFGEENGVPGKDNVRFAGKERDAQTQLDYFGARYYRARVGRFTTVDPVLDVETAFVDPQRWNRYAYALNNPLKFGDPDGKNPLVLMAAAGSIVFGGVQVVQNLRQGRPWHENVGVQAGTGLVLGATLGLAAPRLAMLRASHTSVGIAGAAGIERALRSADAAARFEGETARFLADRHLLRAFDVTIGGRQIDAIAGRSGHFVVEMTIGRGGGKLAQADAQARATGLQVIIYGPNLAHGFVAEALRQGYLVARSPAELEKILGK